MRRYAVITAATAAVVIGGGVAVGSAQQNNPAPTPSPIPASAIKDSLQTNCDESGDQIRREHPDAYVGDCNYGEGTLTTP
jgi:hypothetical protein